jgi:hypothetical protein
MADQTPDRYSVREYQEYAPDEYRTLVLIRWVGGGIVVVLFLFAIASGAGASGPGVGGAIGLYFVFGIPFAIIHYFAQRSADDQVANALMSERNTMRAEVQTVSKDLKDIAERVGNIHSAGHVVMAGKGAVVLIDSQVSDSFNTMKSEDPILADAIQTITGAIEKSGNKEAGQAWSRFLKEMSGERDKSVMHALWDRVVSLVPDVAKLIESVTKLTVLFT